MSDLPEHVRRNRAVWDVWARDYAGPAEAAWGRPHPTWGIWGVLHPSHGDWIRLLRQSHFEIEDLEVWPSANASTRYPFVTIDWARQWPAEEVWKVRKAR